MIGYLMTGNNNVIQCCQFRENFTRSGDFKYHLQFDEKCLNKDHFR